MKKFGKFLLGLTAVAAAIGGILYFLKNILMKDYLDDYDDDDFDNDLYEEENEERDYVTITPDSSDSGNKTEEEKENSEQEDDTVADDMFE
jgi:DUF438 domain-containing protein